MYKLRGNRKRVTKYRRTIHACGGIIPCGTCMHARRCAFKTFAQSLFIVGESRFEEKADSRPCPLRRLGERVTAAGRVPRNRDGTGNELSVDYTSGQSYARKVITRSPPLRAE